MAVSAAGADDIDCSDVGSLPQQDMNECAYRDWQKADAELNALWPDVKKWAAEADKATAEYQPDQAIAEKSLMKAQRAWIDYRDGQCDTEGMQAAGGSIQPLIVASCKEYLTRQRIKELKALMDPM